jgi:hypothetical protein
MNKRTKLGLIVGGLLASIVIGSAIGLSINLIWWLEEANPKLWGAVVGIVGYIGIRFIIKQGKGMK